MIEHDLPACWPVRDPNLYGPIARQGRGPAPAPIPVPAEDREDMGAGMRMIAGVLCIGAVAVIALVAALKVAGVLP